MKGPHAFSLLVVTGVLGAALAVLFVPNTHTIYKNTQTLTNTLTVVQKVPEIKTVIVKAKSNSVATSQAIPNSPQQDTPPGNQIGFHWLGTMGNNGTNYVNAFIISKKECIVYDDETNQMICWTLAAPNDWQGWP